MNLIKENCFYFIKDDFFTKINDKNLQQNKLKTKRPHYFCIKRNELYWMIPCTSDKTHKWHNRLPKSKNYKQLEKLNFREIFVRGTRTVLLFHDMFPITEKYIDSKWIRKGKPLQIQFNNLVKSIDKQARNKITKLLSGKKLIKSGPNVKKIERLMLQELELQ
jgi:hypothetical protein